MGSATSAAASVAPAEPATALARASSAPLASASTSARRSPAPARAAVASDEAALARAAIRALRPIDAARGVYAATLDDGDARLTLARRAAPTALRRPLAYARLAKALDFDLVPTAALRPIAASELGALLAAPSAAGPATATTLAGLAIQNDGAVDALLQRTPGASLREVAVEGHEIAALQIAAGKADAPEPAGLVRAWIQLVALDYLAANPVRRTVWIDADAGRLAAPDPGLALPPRTDAELTVRLLAPLRAVARFPRDLRQRLASLDRERARALLCPGQYEDWLLPPRALIELDERRSALLSLVDARSAAPPDR